MLNYDARHTILSILQATLIGGAIGLVVAAINPDFTYGGRVASVQKTLPRL